MKQLIGSTAAYRIFKGDARADRLSHAYMLYLNDPFILREALKLFALTFFNAEEGGRDYRLILSEGLADMRIYPRPDKKLTVDVAGEIIDNAALRPVERDRKLFIISEFDSASPLVQNKLLKILEEPPEGVYFLLGVTSLSPVLITVKSRVKLLEIPPFTKESIFAALEREKSHPDNASAAASCGGSLGVARNILRGEWYKEVSVAAQKLCSAATLSEGVDAAYAYGDFKYKRELLTEMQRIYHAELRRLTFSDEEGRLSRAALVCAVESIDGALADLKFNANFGALLYALVLKVVTANKKGEQAQ